ncbi:hypothetical protein D3C84_591970 [compost metagenome]
MHRHRAGYEKAGDRLRARCFTRGSGVEVEQLGPRNLDNPDEGAVDHHVEHPELTEAIGHPVIPAVHYYSMGGIVEVGDRQLPKAGLEIDKSADLDIGGDLVELQLRARHRRRVPGRGSHAGGPEPLPVPRPLRAVAHSVVGSGCLPGKAAAYYPARLVLAWIEGAELEGVAELVGGDGVVGIGRADRMAGVGRCLLRAQPHQQRRQRPAPIGAWLPGTVGIRWGRDGRYPGAGPGRERGEMHFPYAP